MGGKNKKITTGYHYRPAFHDGLCLGPLDAYLEFRPGTKTAWSGRITASGTITINQPDLWGGEKDQGGVVGPLNVMFGEATQLPNAYLTGVFGNQTVAWRGIATVAFEGGRYGANNPYAQKRAHKVERIKQGWDDGCWYPEKAAIGFAGEAGTPASETEFAPGFGSFQVSALFSGFMESLNPNLFDLAPFVGLATLRAKATFVAGSAPHLARYQLVRASDGGTIFDTGWYGEETLDLEAALTAAGRMDLFGPITAASELSIPIYFPADDTVQWRAMCVKAASATSAHSKIVWIDFHAAVPDTRSFAKNPAHMLVWAHTQEHCGAQPLETVNAASAQAAADWFYAQGFGLCTIRHPDKESAAEFIRRIERVAGCAFTQNRADGQWYIDIANGEYTLASLPILTDDDIVSFEEVPSVLDEAVNSVSVKYFDPQRKEAITTRPLTAMGLVAEFGTIHQTFEFPEIPTDALANRVASRELLARCTPTRVFTLATTRKTAGWRRNTYFRLQSPKRGIADMVCLLAEVNDGSLKSGAVQIKASQDIYSLPTTVFTETEQGVDTRPPSEPVPATAQIVFEAPHIDVVAAMQRAEFSALPADVGFAVGAAGNPGDMLSFAMLADAGAGYASVAPGDFCPVATLAAELSPHQQTAIALESAAGLGAVEIGSACIIGGEWCRVDAIDAVAGTIDLGRGCADTLPAKHNPGTAIYFYAVEVASDPTEYTDGESISLKLLPRTGSKQLAEAAATALPLTFARRLARQYPPAQLQIGGVSIFDIAATTVVDGAAFDEAGP